MVVREVPYGSDEYQQTVELRNRLLRLPLGLDLRDDDFSVEAQQWHFGMFEEGQLVACVVAAPQGQRGDTVRLRQMAVAPDWQGQGCGRRLLEEVEDVLRARRVRTVVLHARTPAAGFYERLGYRREGEPFVEIGLLHVGMRKEILP